VIHVLSTIKIAGVTQIIESNRPADLKDGLPWFVMPKAIDINEALKNKSTLEIAVQFVMLAETLEQLHDLEITHGEIRPANILCYQGRLFFFDFGAAKYPNKEKITPTNKDEVRKFEIAKASRTIEYAMSIEYAMCIDVYRLAKTLWMMFTKQTKRFDGQYNPNSEVAIKLYCENLNTELLDNLLIESTDIDKRIRPSARQFGMRLKEWIKLNSNLDSHPT
jgi:serine/threonine-protein kinase